jgi:Calpain family cysteine protease
MSLTNSPKSKRRDGLTNSPNAMPENISRSLMPPTTGLSASRQPEGGASRGGAYEPHPNDPGFNHLLSGTVAYGGRQNGQVATRGEGDANEFSPNDVNQGGMGNCYLLAALMALADTRPDVLRNAVRGPKADGTYDIHLFTGASDDPTVPLVPKVVNVSAHFHINNHEVEFGGKKMPVADPGELSFARGGDRNEAGDEELWVKLIEKALAVEAEGYEGLDGGFPARVLEALTGQQNQEFWFNGIHDSTERDTSHVLQAKASDEDLSGFVRQTLERGMPIATTTYEASMMPKDPASLAEMDRYKISPLHAYARCGQRGAAQPAWPRDRRRGANRTDLAAVPEILQGAFHRYRGQFMTESVLAMS